MLNNYLVIDFDGVICDSTYECLVVSYNAWQKYNNLEKRKYKVSDFDINYIEKFKNLRPYVKGAGEYLVLFEIMEYRKINDCSLSQYNEVLSSIKDKLVDFKKVFKLEREILRKKNYEDWLNLHILYDDVIKFMERFRKEKKLFIATLKDKKSINILLDSVNFHISKENIYDASQIKSKLDGLNLIRKNYNIQINEILFIDDNIDHLIDPNKSGYKSFLAYWCNPKEDFKVKAINNNIKILNNVNDYKKYA